MKLSFLTSYQKTKDEDDHQPDEVVVPSSVEIHDHDGDVVENGEAEPMLGAGYGSVLKKKRSTGVSFNPVTDFGDGLEPANRRKKRWALLLAGVIVYVAAAALWNSRQVQDLNATTQDIDLLGKSKSSKADEKAKKEAEKEKKKEDKDAEKKKKADDKAAAKKAKADAKKSVYSSYPGCPGDVDIKYIKTPMAFEDHEIFANASGCHLASIHNIEEFTKISHDGLFKMSQGPEIAMSFMSGKPLAKDFWLGGYLMDGDLDEMEWTDGSDYDFGPDFANATEGCLKSSTNFTEINFPVMLPDDHWTTEDCEVPLPAVYKCCAVVTPPPPPADDDAALDDDATE